MIVAVLSFFILFVLSRCCVMIPEKQGVMIHENMEREVSLEDSKTLKKLFNGKWMFPDSPACDFTPEVSVRFGSLYFCPAQDGDSNLCVMRAKKFGKPEGGLFIIISEEERAVIDEIFEKYGITFPAF